MKKLFLLLAYCLLPTACLYSEEGIWIPSLIQQIYPEMQKAGCKLSAEDIYNINKSCLKDAVVHFGGGCTGAMISGEGLLITNHHCGYRAIQSHSSVQNDYLTNGFWALTKKDELANQGLTATFIVSMEEVTGKILAGISDSLPEPKRDSIIAAREKILEKEAVAGTHYNAYVRSFYYDNEFYLFLTETFRDVRLAGAPPEAIGRFGGDTDNWIWPRHTGDFTLFRIYADKENKPADYSPDNVPYKPKYFFPISLKGAEENDFAMVFGFPGRTTEYLPSPAVELVQKTSDPIRVKARTSRLEIWDQDMKKNPAVRIQYAAKFAGVSNYHKKWAGEIKGLEKADAIKVKQEQEQWFQQRLAKNPQWQKKYGTLLADFTLLYQKLTPYQKVVDYFYETLFAVEIIRYANSFSSLVNAKEEEQSRVLGMKRLVSATESFFKDYNPSTDKKLFSEMFRMYYEEVTPSMHPPVFKTIFSKYKNDFEKYSEMILEKSIFSSEQKMKKFLSNYKKGDAAKIKKDPAYLLARGLYDFFEKNIQPQYSSLSNEINRLQRTYMSALRIVVPEKKYYPDANGTLRISFGKIEGYDGKDAVKYSCFTTLEGIMEKEDSTNSEFIVPKKLKELFLKKNYGKYTDKSGKIRVAMTSSQHTTGGNSGSPLIDADGNLIGLNFDRNWEGTANDIIYDDRQGRSIILDIRYALFVIDKFAGASHLIGEMKIIR